MHKLSKKKSFAHSQGITFIRLGLYWRELPSFGRTFVRELSYKILAIFMDSRARQVRNSADAVHRTIARMIAGHNRWRVRAILRDTGELWSDPMQKKGEKWLRDTVEWPGIRSYINKIKDDEDLFQSCGGQCVSETAPYVLN